MDKEILNDADKVCEILDGMCTADALVLLTACIADVCMSSITSVDSRKVSKEEACKGVISLVDFLFKSVKDFIIKTYNEKEMDVIEKEEDFKEACFMLDKLKGEIRKQIEEEPNNE